MSAAEQAEKETLESGIRAGQLLVTLATTPQEIEQAQRLRWRIFCGEMGAKATPEIQAQQRDFDEFDAYCDHVLVLEEEGATRKVVGTYRLLRRSSMKALGRFYSESEYDVSRLKALPGEILELGRSCVDAQYRSRAVMQLLWRGIADYVMTHDIKIMFGCASFAGAEMEPHKQMLSYLYHHHLAPEELRPVALPGLYKRMDWIPKDALDVKACFAELPALIKGYLRLGGYVGDGAFQDLNYNTTDVSVVVKTDLVTEKYKNRYAPSMLKDL